MKVTYEALSTNQLHKILCKRLPQVFKGVYSSDLLPESKHYELPWCIVVNTDCSHGSGIHWQSWYKDVEGIIHHFCSLGSPPVTKKWLKYLNVHTRNGHWVMQRRKIQGTFSSFCGHYCLYYLLVRCNTPLHVSDYNIMLDVNDSNILTKLNMLIQ